MCSFYAGIKLLSNVCHKKSSIPRQWEFGNFEHFIRARSVSSLFSMCIYYISSEQLYINDYMSHVATKPVFRVSDQVRHKAGCIATEDSQRLKISDLESRDVAKTKALISCAVTAQLICALCFRTCKKQFLMTRLIYKPHHEKRDFQAPSSALFSLDIITYLTKSKILSLKLSSSCTGWLKDWFTPNGAHKGASSTSAIKLNQGVQRRMVLVVNFYVFLKLSFFALLLLYLTYSA